MPQAAETVLDIFRSVLVEMGELKQASDASGSAFIKDLGMDSLALLEFLMLVEERTGVEVTSEDATFDTTLDQLAAFVSQRSA
jgi:acyl carrier protein